MRFPRCPALLLGIAALALSAPPAEAGPKLKRIEFPLEATGKKGPTFPPSAAPLSQRVVFVFDKKPKLGATVGDVLRIQVAEGNTGGQTAGDPAIGTYEAKGKKVVFTPRLPTGALDGFGPDADLAADATLPGLLPDTTYEIVIDPTLDSFLKDLAKILGIVPPTPVFTTAPVVPPAVALETYFANFDAVPPSLQKKKKGGVTPKPGSKGIHPNVFFDPAGLFSSIPAKKRPPFRLRFEAPIDPDPAALAAAIRLRAVEDAAGAPIDVDLPITAALTQNAVDQAEVLLFPSGLLPLGHKISCELSDALASIGGVSEGDGAPPTFSAVAEWTVALSPDGGAAIPDAVVETFADDALEDASVALEGKNLAAWAEGGSNALVATSTFGGLDALGRFEAPPFDEVIVLDTDHQVFPLYNGATPDADPGTVVTDGVFRFSSFFLPAGVTLRAVGSNPLVITCTGDCIIEGRIDVSGSDGASDVTFDSALFPVPGGSPGAGGGRGGDGHPVAKVLPGEIASLQSPAFGGSGEGPGGGGGGQSGCTLPWSAFAGANCTNYSSIGDGSRGSGGGGGSFSTFLPDAPEPMAVPVSGRGGAIGAGDHLPVPFDPDGPFPSEPALYLAQPGNPTNAVAMENPNLTFAEAVAAGLVWDAGTPFATGTTWALTKRVTLGGAAGPAVFADGDPENDFIGPGGELPSIRGGQGGGAGASRTEGPTEACAATLLAVGLPRTTLDARGGAGGGGAGAVLIQAIGVIELRGSEAGIEAVGGNGGGGEGTETSSRGGAGGGGSGGAVVLQSATNVHIDDAALPETTIDVSGGCYANAQNLTSSSSAGTPGADTGVLQFADGGPGGPGLVQVHVPEGAPDRVDESRIGANVYPSVLQLGTSQSLGCSATGRVRIPALVDPSKTPAQVSSVSVGRSVWIDLGAVTSDFRPPVVTSAGPIGGPVFGVPGVGPLFLGTDPSTGLVPTDADGNVEPVAAAHIAVDAPDLLKTDFLPNGPEFFQAVTVLFQGADEDDALPGTPDPASATDWVPDATLVNGKRFLRWEIRIDMAANAAVPLQTTTPRPAIDRLRIPFQF